MSYWDSIDEPSRRFFVMLACTAVYFLGAYAGADWLGQSWLTKISVCLLLHHIALYGLRSLWLGLTTGQILGDGRTAERAKEPAYFWFSMVLVLLMTLIGLAAAGLYDYGLLRPLL